MDPIDPFRPRRGGETIAGAGAGGNGGGFGDDDGDRVPQGNEEGGGKSDNVEVEHMTQRLEVEGDVMSRNSGNAGVAGSFKQEQRV